MMIDIYDLVNVILDVYEQCQTQEQIDNVEKRLHDIVTSQGILAKEYLEAGLLYKEEV